MPVIGISVARLNELLGRAIDAAELADAAGRLGCDVEDPTDMVFFACPACGGLAERPTGDAPPRSCGYCGATTDAPFAEAGRDPMMRLDLLPARPDLMDVGGLARALKGFLGIETGLPEFPVHSSGIVVEIDPSVERPASYRPFIACAVVRRKAMGARGLREIMSLQENLHWAIGRDRKLSSIGVYDLASLAPPIRYTTTAPGEGAFHPLGMPDRSLSPAVILTDHPKGRDYAHLLAGHDRYPILHDSRMQILSMPPIINSEETRVTTGSTDLFIDVTGVSRANVEETLHTLVTSLVELGGRAESVTMRTAGRSVVTPDLAPRAIDIDAPAAFGWLGIEMGPAELVSTLAKMRLRADGIGGERYHVTYPVYRSDIRHPVDIFEDLVIGYGLERIPIHVSGAMTVGSERIEEMISGKARQAMLGLGFTEVMSLMQTTVKNHFERLGLEPAPPHVTIMNPKSADYNVMRCHLLTGVLEFLEKNRRASPPVRLFEIGTVLLLDDMAETGTREERRLTIASMGPQAGYAGGRAVLDAVMAELGMTARFEPWEAPFFVPGRAARVLTEDGREIARAGEIHPRVLNDFGLPHPTVLAELWLSDIDTTRAIRTG